MHTAESVGIILFVLIIKLFNNTTFDFELFSDYNHKMQHWNFNVVISFSGSTVLQATFLCIFSCEQTLYAQSQSHVPIYALTKTLKYTGMSLHHMVFSSVRASATTTNWQLHPNLQGVQQLTGSELLAHVVSWQPVEAKQGRPVGLLYIGSKYGVKV